MRDKKFSEWIIKHNPTMEEYLNCPHDLGESGVCSGCGKSSSDIEETLALVKSFFIVWESCKKEYGISEEKQEKQEKPVDRVLYDRFEQKGLVTEIYEYRSFFLVEVSKNNQLLRVECVLRCYSNDIRREAIDIAANVYFWLGGDQNHDDCLNVTHPEPPSIPG